MTTRTRRIALITGANRGLGRATALRLAESGTDVVLTYRSHAEEAAAVVEAVTALGGTARALRLDTGRVADHGAFADELRATLKEGWDRDTFDFLVNNAGTALYRPFAETSVEELDALLDVHFRGVFFLTQTLLPLLADGGRVINVSTGLTRFTNPGSSAYAAVKGAVEVLTRYLAKELGPRGIRVNTVAPGPVATDFGGGLLRDHAETRAALGAQTALARVGEPDDIGGVITAVLSEGSGWLNGQRVEASGGIFL
ncbi:SDR family NAD(P)-dependent oxidoreductase [Streptomyces avicenniae]|uniref:SDR family NAD(P)-dependent oxidoreductase n=1 Tax=Streptomyces avicenniae TaxID=500153 RepID=UPI00069B03C9|nr:SDR family oxidoreductase [Streptomyces avicenniae]